MIRAEFSHTDRVLSMQSSSLETAPWPPAPCRGWPASRPGRPPPRPRLERGTYCLGGRRPAPGKLARPSSGAVSVSPRVTVSSPGLPPDRARNGHALTSGSIW